MSKFIAKHPIYRRGYIVEKKHFLCSGIYCNSCGTKFRYPIIYIQGGEDKTLL